MSVLATEQLAVGYRGRAGRVLAQGLDLEVRAGELTCVLGANGTGKSTLLRTLVGMQQPLAGRTLLCGDDVRGLAAAQRARRVSVVLTGGIDAGIMRADELVALGRYPHTGWNGRLGPSDWATVRWALEATGAAALAGRNVAELSDGERQRVLIARALAQRPALLALDEPTAFVDLPRRVELATLLSDLAHECGLAVVMTTHDLDLAVRVADAVWLLEPSGSGGPAAFHAGAPEDLVLSGAFGRAFSSDRVQFDPARGSFAARSSALAAVLVTGEGLAAVWAARALERAGLEVVDRADAPLRVHAEAGGGGNRWTLAWGAETTTHARLADLVAHVRVLLPSLAHPEGTAHRLHTP